jgi:hypothetical protein
VNSHFKLTGEVDFIFRHRPAGIATRLLTGQSGVQVRVRARYFSLLQNVQTGSWAHAASYSMGTGGKAVGACRQTIHFHLVPRLRMCGATPVLPIYDFMAWTGKI